MPPRARYAVSVSRRMTTAALARRISVATTITAQSSVRRRGAGVGIGNGAGGVAGSCIAGGAGGIDTTGGGGGVVGVCARASRTIVAKSASMVASRE